MDLTFNRMDLRLQDRNSTLFVNQYFINLFDLLYKKNYKNNYDLNGHQFIEIQYNEKVTYTYYQYLSNLYVTVKGLAADLHSHQDH